MARGIGATIVCLLVVAAAPASAPAAPSDTIRVGGPSDPGDAKRAVVLSSARFVGAPYTVADASGRVVVRGA